MSDVTPGEGHTRECSSDLPEMFPLVTLGYDGETPRLPLCQALSLDSLPASEASAPISACNINATQLLPVCHLHQIANPFIFIFLHCFLWLDSSKALLVRKHSATEPQTKPWVFLRQTFPM